ncbi:MAG: NADH-quinone oxidoreductase subunit J [Rickettsiales bacterium]
MMADTIATLMFYIFSLITVFSAGMVVSSKNPVHSVLFLILAFFNVAGLFVLLGAEYIAMTLVIVYVGAVAILFLFVVMMLNINSSEMREGFLRYLPLGGAVAATIFAEMVVVFYRALGSENVFAPIRNVIELSADVNNTRAIGRILYTEYAYPFQMAGIILLIAMIGAIVLTKRQRVGVRKQNISKQLARTKETGVEIVSVKSGEGIK